MCGGACKKKRQDRQEVGQSSKNSETRSAHLLATEDNKEEEYSMFTCSLEKFKAYETTVKINGQDVVMEIDTGASVSVIIEKNF